MSGAGRVLRALADLGLVQRVGENNYGEAVWSLTPAGVALGSTDPLVLATEAPKHEEHTEPQRPRRPEFVGWVLAADGLTWLWRAPDGSHWWPDGLGGWQRVAELTQH